MQENQSEHTEKTAEETVQDNISISHSLNKRQKAFADAYLETGIVAEALKAGKYTGSGKYVQANRLLSNPSIKDYLEKRGKIVEEKLKSVAVLNGITKENTLLELWNILKNGKKDSDKVASAAQIGKMLGWTKETEQKTTIWNVIKQNQASNGIQYDSPEDISPSDTSSSANV